MASKVNRDGQIAVLISPGYGAGWSTWASDDHRDFALFDPTLVALAERRAPTSEVDAYIKKALGEGSYFYTGGWDTIRVEWLPEGTQFTVEEYDGAESLATVASLTITA